MRTLGTTLAVVNLAVAAPAFADFVLEPGTDSVWITGSNDEGSQGADEWRADGTLVRNVAPFNPFNHRDPRVSFTSLDNSLSVYEGQFAIQATYRGFYVREANGEFRLIEPFATPGALGCNETPSSRACLTGGFVDARGQSGLFVANELGVFSAFFWTGSGYRPPTALEAKEIDAGNGNNAVHWSDDGSFFLKIPQNGDGELVDAFSYVVVREASDEPKQIALPSSDYLHEIAFVGDRLFFIAAETLVDADGNPIGYDNHLFEVMDPLGPAPTPRAVWTYRVGTESSVRVAGYGLHHMYLLDAGKIRAVDLTDGTVVDVTDCDARGSRIETSSRYDVVQACGDRVVKVAGTSVVWEERASAPVTGGKVLRDQGAVRDIVLDLITGDFERLRPGRAPLRAQGRLLARGPESYIAIWEEEGRTCALVPKSATENEVLCHELNEWEPATSLIGIPVQVKSDGTRWWALTKQDDEWRVFVRTTTGDDPWRLLQAWPVTSADIPALLPTPTGFAVDLRGDSIWTLAGSTFVETHRRTRLKVSYAASLDSAGNLYEPCSQGENEYDYFICMIRPDGTPTQLNVVVQIYSGLSYTRTVPLARGLLIETALGWQLVREGRSIALADMYGEFSSPPSGFMNLSFHRSVGGKVIVQRGVYDSSTFQYVSSYFTFDGRNLQLERAQAPRFRVSNSDGFSYGGGFVWLGSDGLWRSQQDSSPDKISYGLTPADAIAQKQGVAPNHANHALIESGRVLLATDDGVWSCPLDRATVVTRATTNLPNQAGCERVRRAPFVERVYRFDDGARSGYLMQQGRRIVFSPAIESGAGEVLSSSLTAHDLKRVGDVFSWQEDGKVVRLDATHGKIETPAPASTRGIAANTWFCSASGLLHATGDVWDQVLPRCSALASIDDQVAVIVDDQIRICSGGACGDAWDLPRPFMPDSRVGTVRDAAGGLSFAVTLGQRLYVVGADGSMTDATPRFAGGSLLLTAADTLEEGLVSLQGGGLVVMPYAANDGHLRHVRIQ